MLAGDDGVLAAGHEGILAAGHILLAHNIHKNVGATAAEGTTEVEALDADPVGTLPFFYQFTVQVQDIQLLASDS